MLTHLPAGRASSTAQIGMNRQTRSHSRKVIRRFLLRDPSLKLMKMGWLRHLFWRLTVFLNFARDIGRGESP